MPALNSEQSQHAVNDHAQTSAYDSAKSRATDASNYLNNNPAIPPLPTYTPPVSKRPSVSSTDNQPPPVNSQSNGPTGSAKDEDSSDPHDFYRNHRDSFGTGSMAGLGQGDIRVEKRGDGRGGSFAHQQRPNNASIPVNGPKLPPLASRINSRYVSSSNAGSSPFSTSNSGGTPSSTAQKRQTSVKELANRFNETADEIPPIPGASASRSASTSSNAASQTGKSRASSRSKNPEDGSMRKGWTQGEMSFFKAPKSPKSPTSRQRRGRMQEDLVSPKSTRYPRTQQPMDLIDAVPLASQSMTDLAPHIDALPRRPLFGEVFGEPPSNPDVGYGISASRPRRTSEGSMHSPNPMFPGRGVLGSDEISPTAFYRDVLPSLEYIKAEHDIPDHPPIHRRTPSDFEGVPSHPPTSRMYGTDMSRSSSPTSTNTSKRNSQSRIPISTGRRLSTASDSGRSTPSTRNNSAIGMSNVRSPNRTSPGRIRAAPPKPLHTPRSPPRHSRSNTPQKSPRHIDHMMGARQKATSPRLNAYISAPMPKKSPPLRSSRPRMPVSSASTSVSRAKAVERFSTGSPTNKKESRTRKPKELEGMEIDIAARRQAIQRSYTRKVGERERQHEETERRRLSMLPDTRSLDQSLNSNEGTTKESRLDSSQQRNHVQEDLPGTSHQTPEAGTVQTPKLERDLKINTDQLMETSVLDLSLEDSPTLGTFSRFSSHRQDGREGDGTPISDEVEPSSAVTAGTNDSVHTFFDDEPQDDSQDSSRRESQDDDNVLSQIMDMQASRSPSPDAMHRNVRTEAGPEVDNRESIQIMLGATPVLEKAPYDDQFGSRPRDLSSNSNDDPDARWSMTSFTSSSKSRDERDGPMERIDEHAASKHDQPAHLSMSTTASDQTTQIGSPASARSIQTTRTTMDSDAFSPGRYSTVNRFLEDYHGPISPQTVRDAQYQLSEQDQLLVRQGQWDPKKVTTLYLQKLARERTAQSNPQSASDSSSARPDVPKLQINKRSRSLAVPSASMPVAEKEVRDDMNEKIVSPTEHKRQESASSFRSSFHHSEIEEGDAKPARASLNQPGDWEISPSLGGYEYLVLDSPIADERPEPPAKDWNSLKRKLAETDTSRKMPTTQTSRPELPPIQGLGLKIHVEAPQSANTPTKAPPPLPQNAPPPPPPPPPSQASTSNPTGLRSPPTPSEYNKHIVSGSHLDRRINGDVAASPVSINSTPRQPPPLPPPLQPSISSVSQDQPSVDGNSVSNEALAKKASPSPEQKRLTKRNHIIKELVDTEHSFCQDMKVVDDIYKGTSNVIVISAEDVKTLFGNSDQIVAFSTNFLDALKQASKSVYTLAKSKRWKSNRVSNATSYSGTTTDDQSSINGPELSDDDKDRKTFIGESFGQHMQKMEKVYSEYLKNHDVATQKLQTLQKNEKVQIWLKECRAYAHDLTKAWDLDSLLVKPVQRILKYPLLLDQLIEVTPENHPDFTALEVAAREMKGISMRINEMKKRVDVMEQMNNKERKRKESDVRIGFPKAFGRRTEKLRQQVGLSELVEDKAYAAVKEKFGSHYFQIQVVMRDTEMYTNDLQVFMGKFCDFAVAMEAHIDVAQTSYPEVESKWRKFRMLTSQMSTNAMNDHILSVRKHVIEPMVVVLGLHQGPEEMMKKREKKLMDYARFKTIKERGDKPDKKTIQQGEQFVAINDTLKDELPKLFSLTGKLLHACLNNFVHLQISWQRMWKKKLLQALDAEEVPRSAQEIVKAFTSDFTFFEGQVMSLSACNGSMLNETINLLGKTPLNSDVDLLSPRQGTSMEKPRASSFSSDKSPMIPPPDFGERSSGSFFTQGDTASLAPNGGLQRDRSRRARASSTLSGNSPRTPEVPGNYRSYSNSITPVNTTPARPNTSAGRTYTEPYPESSSMRPSFDTSMTSRLSDDSTFRSQRTSGSTYPPTSQPRASSPSPYSDVFSSAMPMSDSPPAESPTSFGAQGTNRGGYNVIFLAASVYEFNIDRARREAGHPYLTYVAGEIFDVIGEKGELWLAKNQDDARNQVGWIWNKHFVKLAS